MSFGCAMTDTGTRRSIGTSCRRAAPKLAAGGGGECLPPTTRFRNAFEMTPPVLGISSFCPMRTKFMSVTVSLFAFASSLSSTLCIFAMRNIVSPFFTTCASRLHGTSLILQISLPSLSPHRRRRTLSPSQYLTHSFAFVSTAPTSCFTSSVGKLQPHHQLRLAICFAERECFALRFANAPLHVHELNLRRLA